MGIAAVANGPTLYQVGSQASVGPPFEAPPLSETQLAGRRKESRQDPQQTEEDQIDRHDIVEQLRHDQNQDASHDRPDEGALKRIHRYGPLKVRDFVSVLWGVPVGFQKPRSRQ